MPDLQIIPTQDHSFTLYHPELKSYYHSIHGAVSESLYVYLEASLLTSRLASGGKIDLLEVGLGTGLNFLLTYGKARNYPQASLHYTAYEPFPPEANLLRQYYDNTFAHLTDLNLDDDDKEILIPQLHPSTQTVYQKENISWDFRWEKWSAQQAQATPNTYDIIYYHTFGPFTSPELWTEECLLATYHALKPNGGRLVTFSINSATRRMLEKHHLQFERPKGYGGKREMLIVERC